jgi:hypothetical protein
MIGFMCDRCNPIKNLREIQEKVLPEVRKQSYCWFVACEHLQAADDERVSRILFDYQGHIPTDERGWPDFLITINRLVARA